MRIAIFTDTYFPQINGVSKTVSRYIKYLEENGHEYFLVAPRYEKGIKLTDNRMHVRNVRVLFNKELRFSFISFRRLDYAVECFNPDVIHVMTEFPIGIAGVSYARRKNIPLVTAFETNVPEYFEYYHLKPLSGLSWNYYKILHKTSDIILTPSNDSKQLLLSKGFKNVNLWERGIEANKFNPNYRNELIREKLAPNNSILITYVGRIGREKDLFLWLDIAKVLHNKYGDKISFCIVGDGPTKETLENEAPPYVKMTGFLTGDELLQTYASSDIFLFTSPTETLGFVILEAMASGLPVVACYEGGIKDTLIDGYNGFACRKRQSEDYIEAMSKLIEDDELRMKIGANARKYAETKDWERAFDCLLVLFQDVIDKHSGNLRITRRAKIIAQVKDKIIIKVKDKIRKIQ